jgi:hypothetical protein
MLDVNKCQEILEHHFATVTREEFLANLEEFCPEFIAAGIEDSAAIHLKLQHFISKQNKRVS